jgi:transposase
MRAFSMDLRERVAADCDAGMKTGKIAAKYRVSTAWVRRLKQRRRQTGSIAPMPHTVPPPRWTARSEDIRRQVERTPDATLAELRDRLKLRVSLPTLCRALQVLRLSFKKSAAGRRAGPPRREGGA